MITYVHGNLFESPAKVLVNTVNTVGVMGKGIALEFKRIYPDMFSRHRKFCENGQLKIGKLHLYKSDHKWVLNFPTKRHWRNPSRLEYIEAGLKKFRDLYASVGIASIAFPALGCGNGELDYETQVDPLMEEYLGNLPISVLIYLNRSNHAPLGRNEIQRTAEWLRSGPPTRSFDQAWKDVCEILVRKEKLNTLDGQLEFTVSVKNRPPRLTVMVSDETLSYEGRELQMLWQQIWDQGIVYEENLRECSSACFLLAVFELLPYIQCIDVSPSSSQLWTKPYTGLQIAPDLRAEINSSSDFLEQ